MIADQAGDHAPRSCSGSATIMPRLSDMPTDMKNSPSSRPLNGSMSASRAWRYSESASSTPARKAPSAIDRPSDCITSETATTTSSAMAVNSSRVLVSATIAERIAQDVAAADADGDEDARRPWRRPAGRRRRCRPRRRRRRAAAPAASSGIAARSWNSRMEKAARPWRVGQLALLRQVLQGEGGRRQRQGQADQSRRRRPRGPAPADRGERAAGRRHLRRAQAEDRPCASSTAGSAAAPGR